MQQVALDVVREREWELSQLVDMVPSHLWRLTPQGEPTFFNQRMVDYLGLNPTDIARPGRTRLEVMIETAIHPDDAASFGNKLRNCLATGQGFFMRYRLRRADGVYRWMSSRAEPMRDPRGQIVHWFGLCHDIDDEVRIEDELRRARLTRSAGTDGLAAVIAHDVGQSLAAIAASAHACIRWLTADQPNLERARASAARIVRDAEAASMIAGIRALSRQSTGGPSVVAARGEGTDEKVK